MKNVSAAKFVPDPSSLRGDRLTGCFPIDHTYVADAGRKLRAVMIFVDFPNAKASDLHGRYGSFDYYYDALAVEGLEFYTKSSFGKLLPSTGWTSGSACRKTMRTITCPG